MKEYIEDLKHWWKLSIVMDWYREIKWFIQRGSRGYSDSDIWNINDTLARLIPKMLRALAKNHHGCAPEYFNSDLAPNECKAFADKLEEIAKGFDDYIKADEIWFEDRLDYEDKREQLMSNFKKQMVEFIKIYPHLWD